jgi:hypothetical protein
MRRECAVIAEAPSKCQELPQGVCHISEVLKEWVRQNECALAARPRRSPRSAPSKPKQRPVLT